MSRTPTQDFSYNNLGELTGYDKGQSGANGYQSWTLGYDSSNHWAEAFTENDSDISGAVMTSTKCYYPDGSLLYSETPSQHQNDGNPTCPATTALLNDNFPPLP